MDLEELGGKLECLHRDSFSWAVSCCAGDREEAEDVLQATYLKIVDGRARFGGRSAFKTWLFGVIRRTAAERRRRRRLRSALLFRWADRPASASRRSQPSDRMDRLETAAQVDRALRQLSPRQRQVVELVFYQDLTVAEAAEILAISVGSARVHYARGKEKLRVELEQRQRRHS
jgi:RNA polymerase sigma-70 factor (ECF subfamily)